MQVSGKGGAGEMPAPQGAPFEYTPAEIAEMMGLVPPLPRPGLVREIAEYLAISPAEVEERLAAVTDDGQDRALEAEVARLSRNPGLLEAARVMASVVRHYGKHTALSYLGGLGNESILLSRLGLQVTHVDTAAARLDFARRRFAGRDLSIATATPSELGGARFDVIASFGPLDPALVPIQALAEVGARLAQDGILFMGAGGTIDAAQMSCPGALTTIGLRRAIDCGHTVVYVKDAPTYDLIPLERQVEDMAGVLNARRVVGVS